MELGLQKVYWGLTAVKGKERIEKRVPSDSDTEQTVSLPAQCGTPERRPPLRGVLSWVAMSRPFTILLSHWLGLPQEEHDL